MLICLYDLCCCLVSLLTFVAFWLSICVVLLSLVLGLSCGYSIVRISLLFIVCCVCFLVCFVLWFAYFVRLY